MAAPEQTDIALFRAEVAAELDNILAFWRENSLDKENGGFIGRLSNDGIVDSNAPKGAVLNARILWTFSAAARHSEISENRAVADRAYNYFVKYFLDQEMGGVYWTVTPEGEPLGTRQQIYALAFAIYGLSEYYLLTQKVEVLTHCQALYRWIESHSYDAKHGGYFEAYSREGELLEDLRLSEKDRNDPKTMNTHLHILEAYANLYRAWPDAVLADQIKNLLVVFQEHIIDLETHHLRLFFHRRLATDRRFGFLRPRHRSRLAAAGSRRSAGRCLADRAIPAGRHPNGTSRRQGFAARRKSGS